MRLNYKYMEIRKISDVVYNVDFLKSQKITLEAELAKVNSILEQIEGVKDEEVNLEKPSLVDLVVNDIIVDETI